jgi:ABC-2 type transport system ATP-binding protein
MALVLEDLTVLHGRRAAVSGLWLEVPDGCCTGFLGHNGAGKTTTLRASLGLLPSARGRVLVDGFDVRGRPREARARVGALIEICRFQEGLGGWRNLVELARLGGLGQAAARREASLRLEQVGLGEAASLAVRAYSQGMRQRLGIAQALLGSPRTLLLDEPTNGLDIPSKGLFRRLVAGAMTDERIFIISTHQVQDVAPLIDPIVILHDGRVLFQQSLSDVAARVRMSHGTTKPDANAPALLYCEPAVEGFRSLWLDDHAGDGHVDLELLFNFVIAQPERCRTLFGTAPAAREGVPA